MSFDQNLIDDKIDLAILYFKTKDYTNALNTYNDVIARLSSIPISVVKQIRLLRRLAPEPLIGSTVHPQLGSMLDQRAATYEKLNMVDRALKDASRLVQVEPLNCKGYLRKCKILLALGREIEAFKLFQSGIYIIEKVQKEHGIQPLAKLYDLLKLQYSNLNRRLKQKRAQSSETTSGVSNGLQRRLNEMLPLKRNLQSSSTNKKIRRSVDPFEYLPAELISIIFSSLPIKHVLNCHCVSRKWYKTLTTIPQLYENFHCKRKVSLTEFKNGGLLMKRIVQNSYRKEIKSMRITETPTLVHLNKILEMIICEPAFAIKSLDICDRFLTFQLILNKFSKFNWKLNNFQNLHTLKLGINSSLRYENLIFCLFKKLTHLQVITYFPELSGQYNDNLPLNDKLFKRYNSQTNKRIESMEVLTVINHHKLVQQEMQIAANISSYNPFPLYLDYDFPNLTELKIVSFDFFNRLPMFGEFLLKTPLLKKLTLENNCNFCMMDMLQLLKNYNPGFILEEFGFRDKIVETPLNLNEFTTSDLKHLQSLKTLDLTGSSLTTKGFKKFITLCNKNGNLRKLYIGESSNLYFPMDMFVRNRKIIRLYDILVTLPQLTHLYLNGLELDNYTMKQFWADLQKLTYANQLKVLDLSFCTKIDGMGLLQLFGATSTQNRVDPEKQLRLEMLIIDGIEIKKQTLDLLCKHNYVKVVKCNPALKKWKQFGETSWIV